MFVPLQPGDPPLLSCEIDSTLSLFIKYGHVQWADGSVGPLIFILQWPQVPNGLFIEIDVPGLTNTTDRTKSSKVFLCDSRQGNSALWKRVFTGVILPHVEERMKVLDLEVSALTLDGDALTLNEVMSSEVLDSCRQINFRLGKHGASRTSKDQSSDANKGGFHGVKAYLLKIITEDIKTENLPQRNRMLKLFNTAIANTPGCEGATMPLDYMRRQIDSLITIVFAMANSTAFHPAVIAQSFVIVGEQSKLPNEDGYEEPTFPVPGGEIMSINCEKMLRRTIGEIKDAEMKVMIDAIPEAIRMLDVSGTLTRQQMDYLKIPRLREGTPLREGLRHCRHGAEILTKEAVYQWVLAFREATRKKTPDEIEALRVTAMNAKAILDAEKRMQHDAEVEEKARVKVAEKSAEKARVALLSPAEKKAEKQKKATDAAKNKQDKAAKELERKAADRRIVNGN